MSNTNDERVLAALTNRADLDPSDTTELRAALAAGGSPEVADADGQTALQLALRVPGDDCVRAVIEAGAALDRIGAYGQTAFYAALSWGNPQAAMAMLEAGADPDIHPEHRRPALHEAAFYGYADIVERLIARGADVNVMFEGFSPLGFVLLAYRDRPEESRKVVEHLLAAGAKVDASAKKAAKKLKGPLAQEVAALLQVDAPKARTVKPAELGDFQHTLFERLKAYFELLEQRGDLELRTPLTIDTAPQPALDEPYPPDAVSFARSATDVSFSYRVPGDPEAQGFLHLSLAGSADTVDFLDDAQFAACYELDCDREGVGTAAWFRLSGGKGHILWSVEDEIRFKTLTDYLTKGARRGFGPRWQDAKDKRADAALLARSVSVDTSPDALRAALAERVPASMAADLVEWLGNRAALLLPKT